KYKLNKKIMCSRFENKETGISIFEKLKKDSMGNFVYEITEDTNKINISPTNSIISVIRNKKTEYSIKNIYWGIQFDKQNQSPLIFNSRIETISGKIYWKQLFAKNRCIIPATAFYEWKEIEKTKIPHRISLKNKELFFIASIFLIQEDLTFSSMITTVPNKFVRQIHNRMPVLLNQNEAIDFLDADTEDALKFCKPLPDNDEMDISIAEDILTQRQRDLLAKHK
ncbi:MAG TPA: SOS response-associated peptidase family protein, partial [Ignavibacteria bacterium]